MLIETLGLVGFYVDSAKPCDECMNVEAYIGV